jgi:electron transfer flavoprotein alpha subunit
MKQILVIAEVFEGLIRPVTHELIAAALKIIELQQSGIIKIIIPLSGHSGDPLLLSDRLAAQTGIDITCLKITNFQGYNSDVYKKSLTRFIKTVQPSHIIAAHTSQSQDFAPGLAVRLNAASISGVNGIRSDDDGLLYSRSVFNNTKNMIIRPVADIPVVLTLIPGSFKFDKPDIPKKGQIDIHEISFDSGQESTIRIRHKKILKPACSNQALKEANIIISAGRGIGKKENLDNIVQFAKCFSSSAVGVSRPLVDMKWIRYEHQVGITGTTVSPKVYIACGISGSSQHLAGIKDAQFVVSINNNPDAPIFRHSDLCIVEDIFEFIQVFLKEIKR